MSIMLIEHDMGMVMQISDHIVVLDYGRKIADGPPEAIRSDAAVIKAYLGEPETEELPPEVAADLAAEEIRLMLLRLENVHTHLRQHRGAQGRQRRRRAGPDRDHHRLERRRQVDAADDHLRQPEGVQGPGGLRGPRHHAAGHLRHRQSRHQPGARGPPDLLADDGLREPADGRGPQPGPLVRPGRREGLHPVPAAEGAPQPARRHAVRRRAADAGDRPRAARPAQDAAARRAVAGHRADPGAADLQGDRRDQPHRGPDHPPGRAERLPGAQDRPPRLRAGHRPHADVRDRRASSWPTRRSVRPISRAGIEHGHAGHASRHDRPRSSSA